MRRTIVFVMFALSILPERDAVRPVAELHLPDIGKQDFERHALFCLVPSDLRI